MILSLIISTSISASVVDQPPESGPYGNPVSLVDGGLCVGLAWVKLLPGEVATVDRGPDFDIYRVKGANDAEWGAYSGFAGQSTPDKTLPFLTKDGVTVYPGKASNGSFNGYFIGGNGQQNHFFGTPFKDAAGAFAFFGRVSLGAIAKAKCGNDSQ